MNHKLCLILNPVTKLDFDNIIKFIEQNGLMILDGFYNSIKEEDGKTV